MCFTTYNLKAILSPCFSLPNILNQEASIMGSRLQDKINAMPAKRRNKIAARAEELIQEVRTLRKVGSLRKKT
jgi:hypothetical protein